MLTCGTCSLRTWIKSLAGRQPVCSLNYEPVGRNAECSASTDVLSDEIRRLLDEMQRHWVNRGDPLSLQIDDLLNDSGQLQMVLYELQEKMSKEARS